MDGFEIPIGADFSAMQAAFDRINASVNAMGEKIVAALEKSSAAAMKTTGSMGKLSQGSAAVGTAADQVGAKSESAGKKLLTVARGAIAVGTSIGNVTAAMGHVASVMTALSSNNFGTMLTNLTRIGSGLKKAMTSVWGALTRLGESHSLLKIAAGAAAGVAGVLLLRQAFRTVIGSIRLLKNSVSAVFSGMISAAKAAARGIGSAFKGIASLPGKILSLPGLPLAGLISAAGAIALLTTQVKAGGETAGEIERLDVAFQALTGSAAGSSAILASMRENWLKTGNTISQQAPTIQKFLALGFSSSDALKLQKNILDVAGAVGMTSTEAELLGTALAQVKAKGVVSMEELRQQIAEKGVPVFEALAAKLKVTQAELIKMVSAGKVPASELIDIFMNMEGSLTRFKGGAERMGGTFMGLLSRIQGAWSLLRAEFMTPVIDALKPILEGGIARIQTLMEKAKELGEKVGNAIRIVFTAFRDGGALTLFTAGLSVAFEGAVDVLKRGLGGIVAFLATAIPLIFAVAVSKLSDPNFWKGIILMFSAAGKAIGAEIRAAFPGANQDAIRGMRVAADIDAYNAKAQFSQAKGGNIGAILEKVMIESNAAFAKAVLGEKSPDFQKAIQKFQDAVSKLQETVNRERLPAKKDAASASKPETKTDNSPAALANRAVSPAVMSLTRIGGGGFASTVMNGMYSEAKKQTALLKKIAGAEKPTYGGVARFA